MKAILSCSAMTDGMLFFEDVGTWSQDGDNITLISNDPDGIPATFRIVQLTATNLEMKYSPDGSSYIIIKMYPLAELNMR